jgi:hypothetical protein
MIFKNLPDISRLLDFENNTTEAVAFRNLINQASHHNRWFTKEEIERRLQALSSFLISESFKEFYSKIELSKHTKTVALISEENIPLEDFFTIITIMAAGHKVLYKTSEKQDKILPYLLSMFETRDQLSFEEGFIKGFDKMIIASNKPWPKDKLKSIARFETLELTRHYSIGIIKETDTSEEIAKLALDLFSYFGMGCGNVRKIYVPENYPLSRFFEAIEHWKIIMNHNAYANNYQYHQSVFLMNRIQHLDNGFILLKQDNEIHAPTGVLYYEYYENELQLKEHLLQRNDIHCIYTSTPAHEKEKAFGNSINQLFLPSKQLIDFLT